MKHYMTIIAVIVIALWNATSNAFWHGVAHTTGFYNFTGSNLSQWVTAVAAVNSGARNAKLLALGDSTFAGMGDLAAAPNISYSASWPITLASSISKGASSSFIADGNLERDISVSLPTYNPLVAFGTGWSNSANQTLGGQLSVGATNGGILSYAPTNSVDTFEIWYATCSGCGTATVNIDGGSTLATINANSGSTGYLKQAVTTTAGNHTVNVVVSTNPFFIAAIVAYNVTSKQISVYNSGASGATSTNIASAGNGFDSLNGMEAQAPDLVITEAGIINDWANAIPVATSQANLQTLITAAQLSGNIILMSPVPSNSSIVAYATQQNYVTMMKNLAYSDGIPFIDVWGLFGGTFQSSLMFNAEHPNAAGYALIASYAKTAIANGFVSQ